MVQVAADLSQAQPPIGDLYCNCRVTTEVGELLETVRNMKKVIES